MKRQAISRKNWCVAGRKLSTICLCLFLLVLSACSELEKPKPEPYYADDTPPPTKQEFRWSNGKTPKSFDPALAAAPPETDIIRAVFEGLTDTDPKTLKAIPAVAVKWTASEDNKIWTFELHRNAKWSNGDAVTAEDFVRSWKRLAEMGEDVSHHELLNNIVGLKIEKAEETPTNETNQSDEIKSLPEQLAPRKLPILGNSSDPNTVKTAPKIETKPIVPVQDNKTEPKNEKLQPKDKRNVKEQLGVEAIGKYELKVSLIKPDKDFPALVAHPIFRPIHKDTEFEKDTLKADIITNGAFRIASVGQDGITLDRSENYWNRENVQLERVRFVPQENAEKALQAYRAGEIDAVTNVDFEPLALKLLEPYKDFRRTVHSALNLYEFNRKRIPFDDRRVREAMSIAIDRARLTDDEMDGASKPALGFLPFAEESDAKFSHDKEKAQKLLSDAGFPNGNNFPEIKLVINRNNIQQRIAKSVAKMWKQNLNIETEIIIKESDELETVKKNEDYDLIRRGVVLPTSDETANMMAIFSPQTTKKTKEKSIIEQEIERSKENSNTSVKIEPPTDKEPILGMPKSNLPFQNPTESGHQTLSSLEDIEDNTIFLTEEEALVELPAIPLYFPTSFSLVKPYVDGFDINTLDAPSLKDVKINNFWQPININKES